MTARDIREIKRRLRHEGNNVQRIYGCYVNAEGNIIAQFEESPSLLPAEEGIKYFDIFKKVLSGKPGLSLIDMKMSQDQENGEKYQQLLALWRSELKNEEDRNLLFREIIDNISLEENFVILLMSEAYDVPSRKDDDEDNFHADETFRYMICAICPVIHGKPELGYEDDEKRFGNACIRQQIEKPALGFMFPSFNERATDIHHAAVYCKKTDDNWTPFISAVFGTSTDVPLTGEEQKERFDDTLKDVLEEECTFDVVHAMHQAMATEFVLHKEAKDPNPLAMTPEEIGDILSKAGVNDATVTKFEEKVSSMARENDDGETTIQADVISDAAKMVVETEGVKITVKNEKIPFVNVIKINGKPTIAIDISDFCKINGMEVEY